MKILCIDTCTKAGSVALVSNSELVGEIFLNLEKTHSERILVIIDKLLEFTNIKLKDIDLFICGIGPGSFTGIRIGLSVAKGFSFSLKKKLIGVSSLDAIAMEAHFEGEFISALEGRNNEIFFCKYERKNGKLTKKGNYSITTDINKLKPKKIAYIGNKDLLNNNFIVEKIDLYAHNYIFYALQNKDLLNSKEDVNPLYLKPSDAEINYSKIKRITNGE